MLNHERQGLSGPEGPSSQIKSIVVPLGPHCLVPLSRFVYTPYINISLQSSRVPDGGGPTGGSTILGPDHSSDALSRNPEFSGRPQEPLAPGSRWLLLVISERRVSKGSGVLI